MESVTIDTNVFPLGDLESLAEKAGFVLEVISVTNRELVNTDLSSSAQSLGETLETFHFGEGSWGSMVFGSVDDAADFEKILQIISSGGHPKDRENLTPAQQNQRRDALILQAHIRSGKRVFVSNDERGFVRHGKRELLEEAFPIKIYNRIEFAAHCTERLQEFGNKAP
jgi:hypothetical protein